MNIFTKNIGYIVTFLLSVAVYAISYSMSWQKMKDDVLNLKSRASELEKEVKEINPLWAEIRERLASIEATLKWLTTNK